MTKNLIISLVLAVVVSVEQPEDDKLVVREKRRASKGCRELHFCLIFAERSK